MRATNGIPLGCPLFLPVHTVNCVQTLKAVAFADMAQWLGLTTQAAQYHAIADGLKQNMIKLLYGSFFPTEIYTRGCHWIPRMFASSEHTCDQWHSSRKFILLPGDTVNCVATLNARCASSTGIYNR
jgi:hypothetical protein